MKRIQWLVVGSLVGVCVVADDFDYLAKGYNPSNRTQVENLLKSSLGAEGTDAEKMRAQIEALSESITKNKKERATRKKLLDKVAQNEKLSFIASLPPALVKKRIDKRIAENESIGKKANSLNRQGAVNSAEMNNGLIEESCQGDIDLSSGKLSAEETSKFDYFKGEVNKFLDGDDEKLEKAADEAAIRAEAALQKALAGSGRQSVDKDSAQIAYLSDDMRIEKLKKSLDKEEKTSKSWISAIVKSIGAARKKLRELNKHDRKMSELAGYSADDMLQKVQRVKQEQVDTAVKLRKKCLEQADLLGRNNPLGQNNLLNSAFETMRQWNATYANGEFMTMVQGVSSSLTCPDVTADVESNWNQVIAAAEKARGATDPRTLVSSLSKVGDAAIAAQSQMGKKLAPLLEKLNFACRNRKNVEKFVSALSSQVEEGQGSGANSGQKATARTSGTTRSGGSSMTGRPEHFSGMFR